MLLVCFAVEIDRKTADFRSFEIVWPLMHKLRNWPAGFTERRREHAVIVSLVKSPIIDQF